MRTKWKNNSHIHQHTVVMLCYDEWDLRFHSCEVLGCNAVLLNEWLVTFQRKLLPSRGPRSVSKTHYVVLLYRAGFPHLNNAFGIHFSTSGATCLATYQHITQDLNPRSNETSNSV